MEPTPALGPELSPSVTLQPWPGAKFFYNPLDKETRAPLYCSCVLRGPTDSLRASWVTWAPLYTHVTGFWQPALWKVAYCLPIISRSALAWPNQWTLLSSGLTAPSPMRFEPFHVSFLGYSQPYSTIESFLRWCSYLLIIVNIPYVRIPLFNLLCGFCLLTGSILLQ